MSGRIETFNVIKEETSKWSKNSSFSIKKAGVDIGEDLNITPGTSSTAAPMTRAGLIKNGGTGVADKTNEED